ncbi:hypothetical protein BGZ83_006602, partial [Gryganskiella cystojenkinii]
MHTGYFTSWPPRVDTLDSLGDLHQTRKPSSSSAASSPLNHPQSTSSSQQQQQQQQSATTTNASRSASAPSSPRLDGSTSPRFRSGPNNAFDASIPSASSSSSPQRQQQQQRPPPPATRTPSSRSSSSRPFSTNSIDTDSLGLLGFRNATLGGMLISPSGVPTAGYLPLFHSSSTPSTPFKHPAAAKRTNGTDNAMAISGGAFTAATGGSTSIGLTRAHSAGDRPSVIRSNSFKKTRDSQLSRSGYHLVFGGAGTTSSQPPPREATFGMGSGSSGAGTAATPSANRTGPTTESNNNNGQLWFQPSNNLRKSVSAGKTAKKGLKSRLRKLRHRQGSSSRDNPQAFNTSGESDSEAAFDQDTELIHNTGGITQRYMLSTTAQSTKSPSSPRSKQNSTSHNSNDFSGLPPQPPRNPFVGHSSNKPVSSPLAMTASATDDHHKESSPLRFKDLFKSVGLSNQQNSFSVTHGLPSGPISSSETRGGHKNSKSLQTRSTFPFGDFLSGDDQPSTLSTFRLTGPGKRRRRLTKKSHTLANGMLRPAATDDEDSPATKSGGGFLNNLTLKEGGGIGGSRGHGHKHHTFLHHLHPRRRSRSTGEDGRQELEQVSWKPDPTTTNTTFPYMSTALRDARRANHDPNVLIVELPPLPTKFVNEFKALSSASSKQRHYHHHSQTPSVTHITPSSTAGSGMSTTPASYLYAPHNYAKFQQQLQQYHQCPQWSTTTTTTKAATASAFGTKTFLFRSFQNSKFQGHYIFRVVRDHVEYKKLPIGLEPLCSQYFRETYVTYRGLENKAKVLKEDRERRTRFSPVWSASQQSGEELHPVSEPLTQTLSKLASAKGESTRTTRDDLGIKTHGEPSGDGDGIDILKTSVTWDAMDPSQQGSKMTPSRPPSVPHGRSTGYLEQRYNPTGSVNHALVKSVIGFPPEKISRSRDPLLAALEKRGLHRGGSKNASISSTFSGGNFYNNNNNNNNSSNQSYNSNNLNSGRLLSNNTSNTYQQDLMVSKTASFTPQRPPLYNNRKRSWTNIKEQQRQEAERQRLAEETHWNEKERKHREEVYQTTYGPQLFLEDITEGFEYERFDASVEISIMNDNHKTNVMWLESPHAKLKSEFLNWLAISRMDHG